MIAADPDVLECVNAVRLQQDWRPLAGIGPEHAGSLVDRTIASAVIGLAVDMHNEDVRKAEAKSRKAG